MSRLKIKSKLNMFLLLYIQIIGCKSVMDEYFLQEGSMGHCGQNVVNKPSIILRSHVGAGLFGGITSYQADQQCAVTFQAGTGHKILVHFTFFDIQQPVDSTCKDTIIVSELGTGSSQVKEICTEQDFISVTDKIEVNFTSDAVQEKKGFVAIVTGFHEATCTDTEFKCDTTRCMSSDVKCDGLKQCIDGSDESKELAHCSTLDKVLGEVTSLGKYTVLAISVVVGGVILTVFLTALFWKYLKREGRCCQCSDEDDVESMTSPPLVDARKARATPPGNISKKTSNTAFTKGFEERNKAAIHTKKKRQTQHDDQW